MHAWWDGKSGGQTPGRGGDSLFRFAEPLDQARGTSIACSTLPHLWLAKVSPIRDLTTALFLPVRPSFPTLI